MNQETGKWLVAAGGFIVLAGLILWFWGDKLQWLGRLPGDIRVEKENFQIYFPITTMILVSLVLTIVLWLIRKLTG